MRALITGGCGFVGGHLIAHLLKEGDEVLATARSPERAKEGKDCAWVSLEIADAKQVLHTINAFKPEVVYHLAGMAFVPEAEEHFDGALATNVAGTYNVARACHLLDQNIKVVSISSAEVYGRIRPEALPVREDEPPRPANNYSLTKRMAEEALLRFTQYGKVRGVIVRPFNHIGAGQSDKFVASNFASQLAHMKLGKIPPRMQVGNLSAYRDFSDVRDIVRGYRLAAQKGEGIYNLCSGRAVQIREMLDTLVSLSGVPVTIEQDAARLRAAEVPTLYGSYAKAEKELGWRPEFSLTDTLREVLNDSIERAKRT